MEDTSDFVRFIIAYNAGSPINRVAFYDRAATKQTRQNAMRVVFAEAVEQFAQTQGWQIISPPDSVCFIEVGRPGNQTRPVLRSILDRPEVDTVAVVAIDKLTTKDPRLYRALVERVGEAGKNLIIMQDALAVALDRRIGFVGSQHLYLMGELSDDFRLRSRN